MRRYKDAEVSSSSTDTSISSPACCRNPNKLVRPLHSLHTSVRDLYNISTHNGRLPSRRIQHQATHSTAANNVIVANPALIRFYAVSAQRVRTFHLWQRTFLSLRMMRSVTRLPIFLLSRALARSLARFTSLPSTAMITSPGKMPPKLLRRLQRTHCGLLNT